MIDFSKKRFLVVDDFSEFRSSIKGILRLLAVRQIDTAGNGIEVLEQCRRHRYDVILHDYNLGDGLNGQQVLEQLHAEKLLSPQSIFIMVTAENTQAMVLAALECEPDDYLTKPFNKVTLQTRLERLVRRKQVLAPVLAVLEAGDHAAVLRACQAIQQDDPRHAPLCQRYMAEALQGLGRHTELERLLEQQARSRPAPWNLLQLARLWLRLGRVEQVSRLLGAAQRQFPMMPELRDAQAELAALQNDPVAAQRALQQAVELSPNTLRRQSALACQAWLNNDRDTALRALRQCWEVGRYSPAFNGELLWQLAAVVAGGAAERLPEEAQHWLAIGDKQFRQHQLLPSLAGMLRLPSGSPAEDVATLWAALETRLQDCSALTLMLLGDRLAVLGADQAAQAAWMQCLRRHANLPGLTSQLQQRLLQVQLEGPQQALQLGREAQALHWQERGDEAEPLFEQALTQSPQQVWLNMAAARLYLDQLQQGQPEADLRLNECLQRIGSLSALDPDHPEYARLQSALELSPW